MSTQRLVSPFRPRPLQELIINSTARFIVGMAHRGFGKSLCSMNCLIRRVLTNTNDSPVYLYLAPTREQAKRLVWEPVIKKYTSFIPDIEYNESELKVSFPDRKINGKLVRGATLFVLGCEEPSRIRGMHLSGLIMDEIEDIEKWVLPEVILPALAQNNGWAIFIGTPKGRNLLFELHKIGLTGEAAEGITVDDWESFTFKASETGYVPEKDLALARAMMSPEMYAQEYECSTESALHGSYYGRTIDSLRASGGIGYYPYNPNYPVYTGWDLGIHDATVVWFVQQIGGLLHIIDFHCETDQPLPYHIAVVKSKRYQYAKHFLPHDVTSRAHLTGTTRLDELRKSGLNAFPVYRLDPIEGINVVRTTLPACRFNESTTSQGITHLMSYRAKVNSAVGVERQKPIHDKIISDAADAFRYLAVGLRPHLEEETQSFIQSFLVKKDSQKYENDWNLLD